MAGFGEPGREGAQEIVDVPVFDITECSALLACTLGRRFSVVTTVERAIDQIHERLTLTGLTSRCAGIRAINIDVLAFERDREPALAALLREARLAIEQDRAEVIVLGCGGMGGLDAALAEHVPVPVIDGIAAGVKFAELSHSLGLRPSTELSYAAPPSKLIRNWPVSASAGAADEHHHPTHETRA